MEHTITYSVIKEQLERFQSSLRGWFVKFVFQFLLPLSAVAQVNPWKQTEGENPWGTSEKTLEQPTQEVVTSEAPDSTYQRPLVNNSTTRTFVLENDTVQFSATDEYAIKKQLIRYGNTVEKSNGNLWAGFISGAVLNVFGLPVGLVISVPETPKAKERIQEFKEANPEATEKEVKYVKRGLQKKRVSKGFLGAVGGFFTSTAVYIGVLITSF